MCNVEFYSVLACVDTFFFSCSPRLFHSPCSLAPRKFAEVRPLASCSLPFRPPQPCGGTRRKWSCSTLVRPFSLPYPKVGKSGVQAGDPRGRSPACPRSVPGRTRAEGPPLPRPLGGTSVRQLPPLALWAAPPLPIPLVASAACPPPLPHSLCRVRRALWSRRAEGRS